MKYCILYVRAIGAWSYSVSERLTERLPLLMRVTTYPGRQQGRYRKGECSGLSIDSHPVERPVSTWWLAGYLSIVWQRRSVGEESVGCRRRARLCSSTDNYNLLRVSYEHQAEI